MGFDYIIPLGQSCNVTFLLQNAGVKKETTLFDWFVTPLLFKITQVFHKLGNNVSIPVKQNEGSVYIGDHGICSSHFSLPEYLPMYERRKERMLKSIRGGKSLLFVRFERHMETELTEEVIDDFIDSIKHINPEAEVTLLLFRPTELDFTHPCLITKICNYYIIHSDPYCKGELINKIFVDGLRDVGVDC
jgi:hypothetical protein